MIFNKKNLRSFDFILICIALVLFTIGILTVYSATLAKGLDFSDSFVFRQLNALVIGLVLMALAISISYQAFIDLSYVIYGVNIVLLALVLIMGHTRLGAQRWFSIGGFAFQPSEFIKLSLILVLSNYVGRMKKTAWGIRNLIVPCVILAIPFILVLLQPDLGTALLLIPVFLSILVIGGADLKHIAGMMILGIACLPVFWHFLRDYQKQRLLVFINPNIDPLGSGYTIIQSKIAIGSGGLFGKGWLSGTQNQLNFLPERHTDFIFSVIGEEWGFAGAMAVVFLYFLIIKRAFEIAESTSDLYGKAIAYGIGMLLAFQVIINISMTTGLMPVVGIPLPLVSYGGTSLIATLLAIGLLVNVEMRRSTF